jgi:hypothetical protein
MGIIKELDAEGLLEIGVIPYNLNAASTEKRLETSTHCLSLLLTILQNTDSTASKFLNS